MAHLPDLLARADNFKSAALMQRQTGGVFWKYPGLQSPNASSLRRRNIGIQQCATNAPARAALPM